MGNCCECLGREKGPSKEESGQASTAVPAVLVGRDGTESRIERVGKIVDVSGRRESDRVGGKVSDPEAAAGAGTKPGYTALGLPDMSVMPAGGGGFPSFRAPEVSTGAAAAPQMDAPQTDAPQMGAPQMGARPSDWGPPPQFGGGEGSGVAANGATDQANAQTALLGFANAALNVIGVTDDTQKLQQQPGGLQIPQLQPPPAAGGQSEAFHSARSDVSGLTLETVLPAWGYFAR